MIPFKNKTLNSVIIYTARLFNRLPRAYGTKLINSCRCRRRLITRIVIARYITLNIFFSWDSAARVTQSKPESVLSAVYIRSFTTARIPTEVLTIHPNPIYAVRKYPKKFLLKTVWFECSPARGLLPVINFYCCSSPIYIYIRPVFDCCGLLWSWNGFPSYSHGAIPVMTVLGLRSLAQVGSFPLFYVQ